ncbi:MAG: methyltransferase domain-containing protein [Streptosporangiales bacterium]|nr:methyltransferase domain-containing protein [Streptosporangiales bacterium]
MVRPRRGAHRRVRRLPARGRVRARARPRGQGDAQDRDPVRAVHDARRVVDRRRAGPGPPVQRVSSQRPAKVVRSLAEARAVVPPGSASYAAALAALPERGHVLDVGCGSGGASLPLAGRAARITGVDPEERLLAALAESCRALGVAVDTVTGRWPEAAAEVPAADVVVCHHVLYGAADAGPFARALADRAREGVVIEIPSVHPLAALDPLHERFHGVRRPPPRTAEAIVGQITAAGLDPEVTEWTDTLGHSSATTLDALAAGITKRLGLPEDRLPEVTEALLDLGVDPAHPRFPGTVGRPLVTITLDGAA